MFVYVASFLVSLFKKQLLLILYIPGVHKEDVKKSISFVKKVGTSGYYLWFFGGW